MKTKSHIAGLTLAVALGLLGSASTFAQTAFKQAPQFDADVRDKKLPPVAERLPKVPRISAADVGVYGGTWRSGVRERMDSWARRVIGMENLVLMDRDWSKPVPNVAESWTVNADSTVYTFKLREGMKWSDGQPFTADDIMFVIEHVYTNQKFGGIPIFLRGRGGAAKVEKLGQHEIRVTFAAPNGLFLEQLSTLNAETLTLYPAHYMKQFHKTHNPNVDAAAKAAGFDDWTEYFVSRASAWENPELPVINAWKIVDPFGKGTLMQAVRNPYYWQVDKAGNQLPYIDRIAFTIFQDEQVLLLKGIAGELDMHARHINEGPNKAVLFDNQRRGNYKFFEITTSTPNAIQLSFNQNHFRDAAKAALLASKDFRIGVSHAINRQAIVDVVYIGQCRVSQPAVLPDYAEMYNQRLATQFTEFSRDKASAALDRAGLTKKDEQGRRLGADGKPIELGFLIRTDKLQMIDAADMMRRDLAAVGITARMEVVDRTLFRTRRNNADFEVMLDDHSNGSRDIFLGPYWIAPLDASSAHGVKWYNWYTKRANAVEPPEGVKKQLAIWDEINATGDAAKRTELMKQILEIGADQFFDLGICQELGGYGIVSNRMRNVPAKMGGSFQFGHPKPVTPAAFFFEGGRR
jgi:peptide/nickel transport system substrate-binding protein